MSDSIFPSGRVEGLALAYAQAHLTSETTPEEFARIYLDAYNRINAEVLKASGKDT